MALVDRMERLILDGILGVAGYTFPTTAYLALFTADPTGTGSVANELIGNGYARVNLSGKFSLTTGTAGISANTSTVNFPQATANWAVVTHFAFMESGVQGTDDMMDRSPLVAPVTILLGETFGILIGDLTLTVG